MGVCLNLNGLERFLDKEKYERQLQRAAEFERKLLSEEDTEQVLGWRSLKTSAVQLELIKKKAEEIREKADVFVIVGVGGSNQAARAMIEALKTPGSPEIIYLGNTLSPYAISLTLKQMEGKSIYIDVIAKNFQTLEPGSHFRILRKWMSERYPKEEMADRIVVTGTSGSRLEEIAKENGYLFLQFPLSVGGRYSAFTPVGLLPIAVAGLDTDTFLSGVQSAVNDCEQNPGNNPAVRYATARNLLYESGYDIEMLVSFEPQYTYLTKWWVQLFGESEGKEQKGIFPAAAVYSEDLHSIGQYMQDGRRNLMETFLSVKNPRAAVVIEEDHEFGDQFDYLDGMDFDTINKIAEAATMQAHEAGGVPCIQLEVKEISEKTFGELFYYFMLACAISGKLLGVNPFDQEGVEKYKNSMFAALGR